LIALVAWRELEETQFLEGMHKPYLEARYVSLWHTAHKNKQMYNNITFYIYKETIRQCIEDTSCILPQIVEAHKEIVCFKARMHHMYVQEKRDLDQQWFSTHYRLTEKDINLIVNDWKVKWKTPVKKKMKNGAPQKNKDQEEE
jgi:hypothetical protein